MIRRTGLIDGAVDTLRERITAGEWPVGTRIPPEPALATLLGVGRNTVREAVQSLVHAGLLARRQGSGTYVLSTSELTVTLGRQIADAEKRLDRDAIAVAERLKAQAEDAHAAALATHEIPPLREAEAAKKAAGKA